MSNFTSMTEAEEIFAEARAKGELPKYFGGYPEYRIANLHADMPTDTDAAFTPIQDRIIDDTNLRGEVMESLLVLASDPQYGWIVLHYILLLHFLEKSKNVMLMPSAFITQIGDRLRLNKENLKSCKKWGSENDEEGIWGALRFSNRNLHQKFGVTVLPEEL